MLKFSEIFEFSRENSYFERVRMVRMVRMVPMLRSLADRTFQPSLVRPRTNAEAEEPARGELPVGGKCSRSWQPKKGPAPLK